jgi:2,4-dienoyl-CoA reductase-like NADH-dependent reductase (Old Yellow Enzyme family)
MSRRLFASLTTDEVVAKYVEAAIGRETAIMRADRKEADQQHTIATRAYEELTTRGERSRLLGLLTHDVPIVRQGAAAHVLRFAPDAAIPVLKRLVQDAVGIASLDAQIILQLWHEGRIHKEIV